MGKHFKVGDWHVVVWWHWLAWRAFYEAEDERKHWQFGPLEVSVYRQEIINPIKAVSDKETEDKMSNQFVFDPSKYVPNVLAGINGHLYRMEPGDATRYVMALHDLAPEHTEIINGINQHPEDYVLLTILMPGGCGAAVLLKDSLRGMVQNMETYPLGYAMTHGLGSVDRYTLAACMLAAGVLVDAPLDAEGAARAMLLAPDILAKWEG